MASYEKQKNGTYSVRFRWVDETGREINKRITTRAKTKAQAEKEYIKFLTQNPSNKKLEQQILKLTFFEAFQKYMIHQRSRVKESTLYDIENCFAKHILPSFKNDELVLITKLQIYEWQENLNSKNYAYKYKCKLRGFLFNFYRWANKYYDVDNVMLKVDTFAKPNTQRQINVWTHDEFNIFINSIDDLTYKTFFTMLYYSGARLGELLALNYSDIDWQNKKININKNLSEKTRQGAFIITSPKNATSYREIEMPQVLLMQLQNYLNKKPEAVTQTFLFGQKTQPLATTTLRRKFNEYLKLAEVKPIRMHDFRHSHASLLISLGANILLISKRLGHSNTEITLNTYSHLFPKAESEIISKLNNI